MDPFFKLVKCDKSDNSIENNVNRWPVIISSQVVAGDSDAKGKNNKKLETKVKIKIKIKIRIKNKKIKIKNELKNNYNS